MSYEDLRERVADPDWDIEGMQTFRFSMHAPEQHALRWTVGYRVVQNRKAEHFQHGCGSGAVGPSYDTEPEAVAALIRFWREREPDEGEVDALIEAAPASGGGFRHWTPEQLDELLPEQQRLF